MAEKLMTQEELEALAQKVWGDSQGKIREQVESAIRTEYSELGRGVARRIVQAEAEKIIRPIIEERRPLLVELAKRTVNRFYSHYQNVLEWETDKLFEMMQKALAEEAGHMAIRHVTTFMSSALKKAGTLSRAEAGLPDKDRRRLICFFNTRQSDQCISDATRVHKDKLYCDKHYDEVVAEEKRRREAEGK